MAVGLPSPFLNFGGEKMKSAVETNQISYIMKGIDFSKGVEGGENRSRHDAEKPLYIAHF